MSEGRLDLDKPVYKYLPKPLPAYPAYKDLAGDDRYKRITARMLLDHTSGFANWRSFETDRKLKIQRPKSGVVIMTTVAMASAF